MLLLTLFVNFDCKCTQNSPKNRKPIRQPSKGLHTQVVKIIVPYCTDLEEELRVVGQSLQQLEVSEEKALQREDDYQRSDQVYFLTVEDDFLNHLM
jgi:hypothetical protein